MWRLCRAVVSSLGSVWGCSVPAPRCPCWVHLWGSEVDFLVREGDWREETVGKIMFYQISVCAVPGGHPELNRDALGSQHGAAGC